MLPVLWIVSPCYNSTDILPETIPVFLQKTEELIALGKIAKNSRVLFVDDGSRDDTWGMILRYREENKRIAAVKLAHNSGEQNAYLAGLFTAAEYADVIVSMDCDLQDDIEILGDMLAHYESGCDIVYGVRCDRSTDTPLYRFLSGGFYKIMRLFKTELVDQNSQYRLMSKRAVKMLREYDETEVFLPALVPQLGLKSENVPYTRKERPAGRSGYSFGRLFKLAFSAITSYSYAPLAFVTLAAVFSCTAALSSVISLIVSWITKGVLSPYPMLIASVWGASALILVSMRILGQYICSAHKESKHRPRYQIERAEIERPEGRSENNGNE